MIKRHYFVTVNGCDFKMMKQVIPIVSPVFDSRVMGISQEIIHAVAINFRMQDLISEQT